MPKSVNKKENDKFPSVKPFNVVLTLRQAVLLVLRWTAAPAAAADVNAAAAAVNAAASAANAAAPAAAADVNAAAAAATSSGLLFLPHLTNLDMHLYACIIQIRFPTLIFMYE